MDAIWWIVWSGICAVGSGALVFFVMQSRMEVLLSRQREELTEARTALAAQKEALEDSVRHAHETAKRKALDEFLADIRVEERSYTREHKAFFLTKKSLVRQERIYFRNIPLSNWVEQEVPIEEGADIEKLAQTVNIFLNQGLLGEDLQGESRLVDAVLDAATTPVRKLLR